MRSNDQRTGKKNNRSDMKTKPPMFHPVAFSGALCLTILLACVRAEDWPQWQGPDRNAISKETGLLKEGPKEGPTLAWKIAGLGGGDGAAVLPSPIAPNCQLGRIRSLPTANCMCAIRVCCSATT
jgi:hypothetical protein